MNNLRFYLLFFIGIFLGLFILDDSKVVYASDFQGQVILGTDEDSNVYSKTDSANAVYDKMRVIIAGCSGVCALSLLLVFIKKAFDMGAAAHNPKARADAAMGMLITGISFALLGGTSLFFTITSGLLG